MRAPKSAPLHRFDR